MVYSRVKRNFFFFFLKRTELLAIGLLTVLVDHLGHHTENLSGGDGRKKSFYFLLIRQKVPKDKRDRERETKDRMKEKNRLFCLLRFLFNLKPDFYL